MEEQANWKRYLCRIIVIALFALILPVSCLIIASNYDKDTSPCGIEQDYTIQLATFLNVIGSVSIVYIICMVLFKMSMDQANATGRWYITMNCNLVLLYIINLLWLLFLVIWSGIGFYVYFNQMSDECRQEAIAIMILVCCIFVSVLVGLAACCALCFCYLAANWERDTFYTY